ncbi:MAG: low-complexity tail membrane protein [Oscillatoriaceae cyanobacterium Prado104]|jgi:hypothetical protein|nr:low-complexity tail membrane protein [Oscillatoriaceae cyanobacterium Prado104]
MRSFRFEPFLWIHAAGAAAVPLFLGICLLGLAVGSPVLPVWLEVFLVAIAGIFPILWMQWFRPFYIFGILAVAVKPEKLTPLQQQILARFKSHLNRGIALFVAILLAVIVWQIYKFSPLAAGVTPFPPQWRVAGLLVAALAFLASNLFLQVPASVFAVLLTPESEFASTKPYVWEKVQQDFTVLGWQADRILPPVAADTNVPATVSTESIWSADSDGSDLTSRGE